MLKHLFRSLILAIAAVSITAAPALAADKKPAKKAAKEAVKPYPLEVCATSGEEFGGDMGEPYVFVEKGQEIKLCCKSCLSDFKKDKKQIMAKIAEANKKVKRYTAQTCAVSGHPFGGDMGEPYVFVYKSQEIKLCCKDCLEEFNKDKDALLKKVLASTEKK